MQLVDTHAHLYAKEFDEDRQEMMERAFNQGVEYVYLPNIDSSSIDAMLNLESTYPEKCFAMMGLHPCSVKENYESELAIVKKWLDKRYFCAIGEIGMDLYWDKTFMAQQEKAFLMQVEWALELDIPIIIHSREATDHLIQLLQNINDNRLTGIFHCFTGDIRQAEEIIDLGFLLGIGGVLTFKNAGLDKTVEDVDLKHIVLETDAPYLAPKPYRGKRNETSYIKLVAEKLATIKRLTLEEVGEITSRNAEILFKRKLIEAK